MKWISIKDKLPPDGKDVFVKIKNLRVTKLRTDIRVGYYSYIDEEFFFRNPMDDYPEEYYCDISFIQSWSLIQE